jgi:hypothetical protein
VTENSATEEAAATTNTDAPKLAPSGAASGLKPTASQCIKRIAAQGANRTFSKNATN